MLAVTAYLIRALTRLEYPAPRPAPAHLLPVRRLPVAGLVGIAALTVMLWAVYVRDCPHFDVDVFLRAGAAVGDGRDPYPPAGTPEVYSGFAFVYPYLVVFPFVPLSALGHRAAEVFIAVSVAAVFAGTWLAGARRPRTFALVLAASCTITGLQMGTLNALLFLGLVTLWRIRDTPAAAGVVAALLVYSKLFLAPVLLFLLLTRRLAAFAGALAVLGLLFGVGELTSPVGTHAYTRMLSVLAREEAPDGLSLTGLLVNVGIGLDAASRLAWVVALGLVAACWRAVRGGHREHLLFAGTVAAALIASPVVWSHYLLLLVAPLLVVAEAAAVRRYAAPAATGTGTGERLGAPGPTLPPRAPGPTRSPRGAARESDLDSPDTLPGLPDVALAAFTIGNWLLVTPHLSTAADTAGAVVVLTALAGPVLVSAAARPVCCPGGRARALRVGVAAITVGVTAVGACLGLRAVAVSPGAAARVVGAYWALLGVLAFLGWAWAHTGGFAGGRRAPAPGTSCSPA